MNSEDLAVSYLRRAERAVEEANQLLHRAQFASIDSGLASIAIEILDLKRKMESHEGAICVLAERVPRERRWERH